MAGGAVTLLSIVTVVKDDLLGLRETLASLSLQPGVELVVIDSSSDREAVPSLLAEVLPAEVLPAVRCSWVAPAGVYPAMNAGLADAVGDYTYFLNAGDLLADGSVLPRMTMALDEARPTWAWGPVRFVTAAGDPVREPAWEYAAERRALFARGRFPAHQGVVISTSELRRQGGFDLSFRIAADYLSILRCADRSDPLALGFTVAEFREGGLSTTAWREALGEFHRARILAFHPSGWAAVKERLRTVRVRATTSAYRALWAEGRPAHDAVTRFRGR